MKKQKEISEIEIEQRKRQFIPKREPLFYGQSYEEVMKKKYQRKTIADGNNENRMPDDSSSWYEMLNNRQELEEFER